MSEKSLLGRVADGDFGAMQQCIDEYSGLVWSLARRLCPNPAEAEDGVQDAFIALWENANRYDSDKGSEATFVAMIARRRLIDRSRSHARYAGAVDRATQQVEIQSAPQQAQDVTISEEAARAEAALRELPEKQREVLRLAIHRGFTHEQIAEMTQMPLGTVKSHARRGLIRVREMLGVQTASSSEGGGG